MVLQLSESHSTTVLAVVAKDIGSAARVCLGEITSRLHLSVLAFVPLLLALI